MASTTTVAATHAIDAAQRDRIEAGHDHGVDHTHGDMNTRVHEKTFDGFVSVLVWSVVGIALILIFLALANT